MIPPRLVYILRLFAREIFMAELAIQVLNQPVINVAAYRQAAQRARSEVASNPISKEILILGAMLIVLQFLDGLLTAMGINVFGISAEGNPMIRYFMSQFGHIPALIIVKSLAIAIVCYLCSLSNQILWISGAMKGMICIYLCAAIIPWSAILFTNLLV